jgi:hypothetical protein
MRLHNLVVGLTMLAASMLACTLAAGPTPASPAANSSPTPTSPPIVPTNAPPLKASPASTTDVIAVKTPTIAATVTATLTTTLTSTAEPTVAAVTPTPRPSSGPLDFDVAVVGCRLDPSRKGGVILTLQVTAVGGNGVYTYVREGQVVNQTSERPATKGTAVIDAWHVQSGDGQSVEKKIRFTGSQFGCP